MSSAAVVFDVAGVVVHWQPLDLLRTHLPEVAHDEASAREVAAQVFQGFTPEADWGAFDRGDIEPEPLAERIARRTGYSHAGLAALIAAIPRHLQPMPATVALIERLRAAGHRLGLLSNMPRGYAQHLEKTHACFQHFEVRAWSGHLGMMKPQAAIFDHLRRAMAFNPADTVFIDDHLGNVQAARALGWQAIHFTDAASCEQALVRGRWLPPSS